MYNCITTEIVNCSFTDNRATSIIQDSQHRGNAGGVAIGFHGVSSTNQTKLSVLVVGSTFKGNTAHPGNQVTSSTLVLQRRVFVGRGGGMAVYVAEDDPVTIKVIDCTFVNNSAATRGGGVYTFFDPTLSNHEFLLADSLLEGNSVIGTKGREGDGGAGGGIATNQFTPLDKRFPNSVVITNCTFRHNQGRQMSSVAMTILAKAAIPSVSVLCYSLDGGWWRRGCLC